MKKIAIKLCVSKSTGVQIKGILKKLNEFRFVETDSPDFVIFDETAGKQAFKNDRWVRIQWSPELIYPDFNVTDYAIGNSYMDFGDRYFRIPSFLLPDNRKRVRQIMEEEAAGGLQSFSKNKFCNFIYSNSQADKTRERFFKELSKYKFVHSAGRFLNNCDIVPTGKDWNERFEKTAIYQKDFKFTIVFENAKAPGYTTEKILQAFLAGTIPIYYGNPDIGKEINREAIIFCNGIEDFDDVIAKIKEIDRDDKLYKKMLEIPRFCFGEKELDAWEEKELEYLRHIFSQSPERAIRRIYGTSQRKRDYEKRLKWGMEFFSFYYTIRKLISNIKHGKWKRVWRNKNVI